jgi:hypothetical protein
MQRQNQTGSFSAQDVDLSTGGLSRELVNRMGAWASGKSNSRPQSKQTLYVRCLMVKTRLR